MVRVHVRYQGTDTALPCALPAQVAPAEGVRQVREEFERSYRRRFEFMVLGSALVIEAVSVECIAPGADTPASVPIAPATLYEPAAGAGISMYCLADTQSQGWADQRPYCAGA